MTSTLLALLSATVWAGVAVQSLSTFDIRDTDIQILTKEDRLKIGKIDPSKKIIFASKDTGPTITRDDAKAWLKNPDAELPSRKGKATFLEHNPFEMKSKTIDNPGVIMQKLKIFKEFYRKYGNKRVFLVSEQGKYLTLCRNCGGSPFEYSAALFPKKDPKNSVWVIHKYKDKIAFRAANGNYIMRVNGGWYASSFYESLLVASKTYKNIPATQFTPEPLENNKWAFRGDLDYYMTWATNCVAASRVSDFIFALSDHPTRESVWTIVIDKTAALKQSSSQQIPDIKSQLENTFSNMGFSQQEDEEEKRRKIEEKKSIEQMFNKFMPNSSKIPLFSRRLAEDETPGAKAGWRRLGIKKGQISKLN